jgi:hypothetical protein
LFKIWRKGFSHDPVAKEVSITIRCRVCISGIKPDVFGRTIRIDIDDAVRIGTKLFDRFNNCWNDTYKEDKEEEEFNRGRRFY